MSASVWFFIECFNHKNGQWEKFDIYRRNDKGEIEPCDLWPWNGTHDVFSIIGFEDSHCLPEFNEVHDGLPINASTELYQFFDKISWIEECGEKSYTYIPTVRWFNLVDARFYLQKNPTVEDIDAMEQAWIDSGTTWEEVPKIYKENPLQHFVNRVDSFISVGSEDYQFDSDIRIIGMMVR